MKFLAILFLLFFKFTFLTYANEVVYIDMSYILSNSNHGKSILDELESFADAINNNTKPIVTLRDGTDALRVAHQIIDCF